MNRRQLDEEAIFHVARDIANPDSRSTYLDQVCAGDQALRERVGALLAVHEQEQEFLKSAQSEPALTVESTPLTERAGMAVGRYKLMEQIGEGGMGVVFVAEQERPIRRKVAVKVIKPGMDTKTVVARFEAERQALAMMDHPNIAKVLDAGTTDSGRPFFAMELVKGVPITDYCDRNRLTIRKRLELFIQVCQAIQHAHQKGIIHRDIKPSNVLVTLHDGTPAPKVIDFGVAKALNARLTNKTIYTEHLQVVGTLLYMSPEQAELSGLDVDTRSDIYSLGVLLYELLTGTTPFQKEDLENAGFDEQRRIIRDQEPPRASVRISSLGATGTVTAKSRQTTAEQLRKILKCDLDWIVGKAIEKDRTRRYANASSFADDVDRYLRDESINARPPSQMYRFRKFAKRNQTIVLTTGLVTLLFLAALASVGYSVRLKLESARSIASLYFRQVVFDIMSGRNEQAQTAIDEANEILDTAERKFLEGMQTLYGGDAKEAATRFREASELRPNWVLPHAANARAAIGGGGSDPIELLNKAVQVSRNQNLTTLEEMFLAYPRCVLETTSSNLEAIREIRDRERTPLADVIMADALTHRGSVQGQKELINEALECIAAAEQYLPENAYVLSIALFSHIEAIALEKDLDRKATLTEEGVKLAHRLKRYPDSLGVAVLRAVFYNITNDIEGMRDIESALQERETLTLYFIASAKYRRGEYAETAALLERATSHSDLNYAMTKAWTLAFTKGCDGPIQSLYTQFRGTRFTKWWTNEMLLLMQQDNDFRRARCEDRLQSLQASRDFSEWEEALLRYIMKDDALTSDEERLVALAKSAEEFPRAKLSRTYAACALKHLGRNELEVAREHLKKCADVDFVIQSPWARAFLDRLERDDAWPVTPAALSDN